jgi:hypothetical protein
VHPVTGGTDAGGLATGAMVGVPVVTCVEGAPVGAGVTGALVEATGVTGALVGATGVMGAFVGATGVVGTFVGTAGVVGALVVRGGDDGAVVVGNFVVTTGAAEGAGPTAGHRNCGGVPRSV